MTVGPNVKGCYFAIKSAQATLEQLTLKTNHPETKQVFQQANQLLLEIKNDLDKQVIFLTNEEPQY